MNKRKLIIRLLLCSSIFLFIYSCKKEDELLGSGNATSYGLRGSDCYSGIDKECGVLKFTDFAHYLSVYDCLEAEYEDHVNHFDSAHSSLTLDQYNDLIDSLGWDEDEQLVDFESAASHRSYRALIADQEASWLSGGAIGTPPAESEVIGDDILSTILTEFRAMIIGDTLYWFNATGHLYTVYPYDCKDVEALALGDTTVLSNERFALWAPNPGGDCIAWGERMSTQHFDSNNKKYVRRAEWKALPWGTVIKGKAKTYGKKGSNWKKRRWNITIRVYGTAYDYECNESAPYDQTKSRRGRKLKNKHIPFGQVATYLANDPHYYFEIDAGSVADTSTIILDQ